jgi:hypothetical protein
MHLAAIVGQKDPLWVYPVILGGLAVFGFILWLLDRHSAPSRRTYSSMGNALMRMEASFLPGREHVVEAIERDDAEADEQGETPADLTKIRI